MEIVIKPRIDDRREWAERTKLVQSVVSWDVGRLEP